LLEDCCGDFFEDYAKLLGIMTQGYKSITGLVDQSAPPAASGPATSSGTGTTPQFATVEYAKSGTALKCAVCGSQIVGTMYTVDGKPACAKCALPTGTSADSHAAYVQALIFGTLAAAAGLACYATFTIVTHFYFGYVALGVGWMVAKAMMAGSKGVGGTRYQAAAAVLTYAAISLASVPIHIARLMQAGHDIDWASQIGPLIVDGLLSPFLYLRYGLFGVIGLVILFVGIRIAVRMTKEKRVAIAR
jgi:hypothetical protein